MRSAYSSVAAAALILSAVACSGDNSPVTPVYVPPFVDPAIPKSIIGIFPSEQVANVGSTIFPGLRATVLDAKGQAIAGTRVTFEVTAGGGSVSPAEAVTKSDGSVTVDGWKLGPQAGPNALVVKAGDASTGFTMFGIDPAEQPIAHYRLVQVDNRPVPYLSRYNDLGAVFDMQGSLDLYSSYFTQTFTFIWAYGKGDLITQTVRGPYTLSAGGSLQWGIQNVTALMRGDSLYVAPTKLPDDLVLPMVYLKQ